MAKTAMTIDLNAITRTRIPAQKVINQYKEGRRDFRNLDLRNYSFKKQDLRDADFSGSDIRGCSFEGATLENTNFSSVITGFSQSYWFNLFVSAGFGFLIWNYCLIFTAKYIEMITNPFKVAVEEILGIYVAEVFTIIDQAPLFFTVIIMVLLIISVPCFMCDKKYLTNYGSSLNSSLTVGLFSSLFLSIIFMVTSILIEDLLHLRFHLIRSIALLFFLAVDSILLYRVLRTLFVYKTDGTTFNNANLNRAKFDQSSIKNCSFTGSSLDHASFSHAVLKNCSFTNANISYVNWRYSQFIPFTNYFTNHCNLLEKNKNIRTLCTTRNGNKGDYQNADLKQLDLSGIDLTGADLSGAELSNTNLQNALLEGANLSNCKAGGTDFTGAIINNDTNFQNLRINESTKFSDGLPQHVLNEFIIFEEKTDELNFAGHNLQNLSFKDQNLTGANFTGADIRGCCFEGAILENSNFSLVKAGRSNQQFFYAILCIVTLIISSGNIYFFGTEYVNLHLGEYLKQHTGIMTVTLLGISYLVIVILVFIYAILTNFTNLLGLKTTKIIVIDKRIDSIKKSSNIQSTYYECKVDDHFFWIPFWLVLMTLTGIESMRRFASISTNGVIVNINIIFFLVLLGSFIFFLYRVILAFLSPLGYSGTSFNKANLNHAIFNQANLKDCNFTHANLDNCNFERAIFIRSRFDNTSLAYTNWESARFRGRLNHFSGYLINDKVRRLVITRNGRDSNFQEAYFEQLDLRNVDLSGSNLNKANFQNTLLEGANLANAQALGTDFTGAIIKDTNFENLRIDSKTKFSDDFAEDILDKCLNKSILVFQNFNFSKRNLQNLSFKDLDLTGADFSGANIRGCSFEGAILENANFSWVIAGRSSKQLLFMFLCIMMSIILTGSLELLVIDYVNLHFSLFLRQFTGMMAVPFLWLTHLVVGLIVVAVAAGINLLIIFLLTRPKQNQSKSLEILNLNHFEYIKTVQTNYWHILIPLLSSGIMTISAIGSLFLLTNSYSYTTGNAINIIALLLLLISFLISLLMAYTSANETFNGTFNGTSFNDTILNNSTFYQANLGFCYFANANLDNCNFERANFAKVDFTDSSLIYTNWKGVKFGGFWSTFYGYLKNDNVRQLIVTRNGRNKNYRGLELTQLDLQGVDLSGADLRNADLSNSNLKNAKLNRTNLQNAKVFGTDFSEAVISNCNLENLLIDDDTKFPDNVIIPHDNQADNSLNLSNQVLDFSNRILRNISYIGQNLEGANFSNSVIINCNFKDANLREANFVNARIVGKTFSSFLFIISCLIGVVAGLLIYINKLFIALLLLILYTFILVLFEQVIGNLHKSIVEKSIRRSSAGNALFITLIAHQVFVIISNFGKTNILSHSGSLLLILIMVSVIYRDSQDQEGLGSDSFDNCNLDSANFSGSTLDKCDLRSAIVDHIDWSDAKFINCIFPASLDKKEIQELCSTRNGREKDFTFTELKNLNLSHIDFTAANFSGSDLTNSHFKYACLEQANLSNVNAIGSDFTGANFTGACIENWTVGANTNFNNIKCEYIYLEQGQRERKPASGSFQEGDFEKIILQYQKSLDLLFRNGDDPEAFKLALPLMLELRKEDGYYFKSIENIGDGDILLRLAHNNPNPNKALAHSLFTKLTETIANIPQSARQTYQSLVSELAKILPKDAKQNYEVIETELMRLRNQLEITQTQVLQLTQEVQTQKETKQSQRSESENDKIRRSFSLVSIAVENMFSKINKAESSGGDAIVGGIDNKNLVVGKNQTGVSGRDISNSTINQLQASSDPNAKKLAELLKQLQSTIEQSSLNSDDKESAQEHISNIAQFANNQQSADLKKPAKISLDALETVLRRVSGLFQLVKPIIDTVRTILLF